MDSKITDIVAYYLSINEVYKYTTFLLLLAIDKISLKTFLIFSLQLSFLAGCRSVIIPLQIRSKSNPNSRGITEAKAQRRHSEGTIYEDYHFPSSSFSRLSRFSAESLKRNCPLIAALILPVSSETTIHRASLACDIPIAAR